MPYPYRLWDALTKRTQISPAQQAIRDYIKSQSPSRASLWRATLRYWWEELSDWTAIKTVFWITVWCVACWFIFQWQIPSDRACGYPNVRYAEMTGQMDRLDEECERD